MEGVAAERSLEDIIKEERRKESRSRKIVKPVAPREETRPAQKRPHAGEGAGPQRRSHQPRENGAGQPSVQVSNLPSNISAAELQTLFASCGSVEKINTYWVPQLRDKFNARVFYKSKEEAKKAADVYHGAKVDGKVLTVYLKADSN